VSRKRIIVAAVLAVGLVIVMVVVAIALDRQRDGNGNTAAIATTTTGVSSPYDFVELPEDVELETLEEASFVSILVEDDSGTLTSYGVSAGLPATQALMKSFSQAEELDTEFADIAAAGSATEDGASNTAISSETTITFVLPSRETLTFMVDLDTGLAVRAGRAWQVEGDLGALVEAAISSQR
jgi:hypothetical protein